MGGVWFVIGVAETKSQVEPGSVLGGRPKPHTREVNAGLIDQSDQDPPTSSPTTLYWDHVDVTDPGHTRVVHVGVSIETTHADQPISDHCLDDDLAGGVETVRPIPPVVDQSLHEVEPLVQADADKPVDLIGQRGKGSNGDIVCDH